MPKHEFKGFPEPQFTYTPNLIFDQLLSELSGSQLKVLLYIVRKSMGWKDVRKNHSFVPASIVQVQAGTGLSRESVMDALGFLHDVGYISRKKKRDQLGQAATSLYRLRFDTDKDEDDQEESEPRSENSTLENTKVEKTNVGKNDVNLDLGDGPSISVFKEGERKLLPPTHSTNEPNELLTVDEGEEIVRQAYSSARQSERAKQIRRERTLKLKAARKAAAYNPDSQSERLRQMRESAQNNNGGGKSSTPDVFHRAEDATQPKTPAIDPSASNRFPARWNELVPDKAVDLSLFTESRPDYQDAIFVERFDEICAKFRSLIGRGAQLTYRKMFLRERGTGTPWWKLALTDDLDWTTGEKKGQKVDPFANIRKELGLK